MKFRKAVTWSHMIIEEILCSGSIAIDATAGNGHDSLFLCERIGSSGHLYSFDIQEQAISATRSRLVQHQIPAERYTLIQENHSNMNSHIPPHHRGNVQAIMFNFGYLPGGDHDVITQVDTSLAAVAESCEILAAGGRMTLTFYTGHTGGLIEAQTIQNYLTHLPPQKFVVLQYQFMNLPNNPPYVFAVEKVA
jgi:hypothetical protein